MRRAFLFLIVAVLVLAASPAAAQTTPPFSVRAQVGANAYAVAEGGNVPMPADAIGMGLSAVVTVTYRGTTTANINVIEFTGSTDFSLVSQPEVLPLVLTPNQSFTVNIRYQPTTSQRNQSLLKVGYNEGRTFSSINANFTGTAPEFALSYIPPGGNATPLQPQGTITFPVTPVNTTVTASVIVANRGTGSGVVNSIAGSGAAEFQLVGLPLPSTTVDAGKELRFSITFTPKQIPAVKGLVNVSFIDRQVTFTLDGSGSGPAFAYEQVQEQGVAVIAPGQLLALPDVLVNEKSSIQVRFRNTGNADARIAAISVQGTGFTLSDSPFLPLTLTPGSGSTVTVTFAPTQPGKVSGRLRIGDDSFELSGSGLGATLTYAFVSGSVVTQVLNNGTIPFPTVAVGATSSVQFQVSNTGTAPASVGLITIAGSSTVFTLANLPALPATVEPGSSVSFSVNFVPTAQGPVTATLRVDGLSFTLSASANPPAALSDYRFDGASGSVGAMQQLAVGLALSQPYPLPLTGTLTLAFNSEVFSNDPAVQFAAGGRTITFVIPANTTRAIFPSNQNQVRLQTGTVAGFITLTPSFATDTGINLTPTNPPALTLTIPQGAPQLLSVQFSAKTASTITILVTGYATSRSITQMDFQFRAVADETVNTQRITANVEASFLAWYSSQGSQQYGGLFTATIPFNLAGDVKNVTTVADTIQSITVTLTNRLGTSASRTLELK